MNDLKNNYVYKLNDYQKEDKKPIVSDIMFHTMFNNESRKKYICFFLSNILNISYRKIYDKIIFANVTLDKIGYYESKKIVDLLVKIDDEYINVEMNSYYSKNRIYRNFHYLTKIFSKDMRIGSKYKYNKVIQININNYNMEDKKEEYMMRTKKGKELMKEFEIINISLPKIRKKMYNKEKLSKLEKFLLIANEKDEELCKFLAGDEKIMNEYLEESKKVSKEENLLNEYTKEQEDEMIYNLDMKDTYEEGKEKGISQGISQGKLETAKLMKQNNVDINIILRCTGLSKSQIMNL